jgi:hypothetical protein
MERPAQKATTSGILDKQLSVVCDLVSFYMKRTMCQ